MIKLQQLAQSDTEWSLEQLVEITNNLLPQLLGQQEGNNRVQEEVNSRLVRHYTTTGLIDKPFKVGREARYTYRHLIQLLVIRRLLMAGCNANSLQQLVPTKSNEELEALLQGEVQLTVQMANPALAYLQQIQARQLDQSEMVPTSRSAPAQAKPLPAPTPQQWLRVEVLPGLEIHVREDFVYPPSAQERQNLLQVIAQQIIKLTTHRRRS